MHYRNIISPFRTYLIKNSIRSFQMNCGLGAGGCLFFRDKTGKVKSEPTERRRKVFFFFSFHLSSDSPGRSSSYGVFVFCAPRRSDGEHLGSAAGGGPADGSRVSFQKGTRKREGVRERKKTTDCERVHIKKSERRPGDVPNLDLSISPALCYACTRSFCFFRDSLFVSRRNDDGRGMLRPADTPFSRYATLETNSTNEWIIVSRFATLSGDLVASNSSLFEANNRRVILEAGAVRCGLNALVCPGES